MTDNARHLALDYVSSLYDQELNRFLDEARTHSSTAAGRNLHEASGVRRIALQYVRNLADPELPTFLNEARAVSATGRKSVAAGRTLYERRHGGSTKK